MNLKATIIGSVSMASLQHSHHAAHLLLLVYSCVVLAAASGAASQHAQPKTMKLAHFTYVPGSAGYTCSLQCQAPAKRDCGDGCKVVGSAMRLLPPASSSSSAPARVPGTAAARYMREKPVQLWDAATGASPSFRTFFVIRMSPEPGTCMADGMAFLLAPATAVPRQSWGRALGVAENGDPKHLKGLVRDGQIVLRFVTHGAKSPYVALSSWGSHGNALQSDRMYPIADARSMLAVWLGYDAGARSVEVKMAAWKGADDFTDEAISSLERGAGTVFTAPLDLTESAESSSYVGFSAATGACTEINELFYWEFQQFKQGVEPEQMPEAPSPAPGPAPVTVSDENHGRRQPVQAPFTAHVPTPTASPATWNARAPSVAPEELGPAPSVPASAPSPAYAADYEEPVPAPTPGPSMADAVPAPSPAYGAEEPAPGPAPSVGDAGPAPSPAYNYAAGEPAPSPAPSVADVVPAPNPNCAAGEPASAPSPSVADVVHAPSPRASAEKQAPAPFASASSPVPGPAEGPSLAPSSGHKSGRQQLCDRQMCKLLVPLCQMAGHVAPGRAW